MENTSIETTQEQTVDESGSRRQTFNRAGAFAGAAVLGAAVMGRRAQAQTSTNEVIIVPNAGDPAPMATDGTMTGGAMMGTGMAAGATPSNPFGNLVNLASDVDIFNFALILEYLEADFYNRAVNANTQRAYLKGRVIDVAQKLASDENAHVEAITRRIGQLGGTPVASPSFQFPSEVFISEVAFLDLAGTLEQNGVHAYLGAAPKIRNRDNLRFAASIYGIEARHTGLIRLVSGRTFSPDSVESPLPASEIANRSLAFIIPSS